MAYRRRRGRRKYGRRKFKRRVGFKRFSRRRRNGRNRLSSARQGFALKDAQYVKLKYWTYYYDYVDTTIGVRNYYYRGNSPYDPDASGVGAQPNYWDNYAALYSRYKCYGSKIQIWPRVSNDSSTYAPVILCITPKRDAVTTEAWDDVMGNPYTTMKVPPNKYAGYSCKIKNYMSTAKIFGVTKRSEFSDADFSADVTTNPANQFYWQVKISSYDGGTVSSSIEYAGPVCITYYVKFYRRNVEDRS